MSLSFPRNKEPDSKDDAAPGASNAWRRSLERAQQLELTIVRRMTQFARRRVLWHSTIVVNALGNGWIYVPLALLVLASGSPQRLTVLWVALVATAVGHVIHHVLKRGVARLRPFEKDPSLSSLSKVLDKYSFPSGHCMTLTTAFVPIVQAIPTALPIAIAALTLLGCCRIVAAHHYLSDVLAGVALGIGVALPLSLWLLPG